MLARRPRFRGWQSAVAAVTLGCFAGCASSTLIQSQPSGAQLFVDGQYVGTTPYTMTDTKPSWSGTQVRLVYPGFEDLNGFIIKNEQLDVAAFIGGFFCVFISWLWLMEYQAAHVFELAPLQGGPPGPDPWNTSPGYGGPPPPQQQPYPPPPAQPYPPPPVPPYPPAPEPPPPPQ